MRMIPSTNCNTVQSIQDTIITWQCLHRPGEDEEPCGLICSASLDDIGYSSLNPESALGATLRMPDCECGAHTDLNIGFTIRELYKLIDTFVDTQDVVRGYTLPFRYMHNLRLHSILHERGSVPYPAILPMPPRWLLEHPAILSLPSVDLFYSLWFAYGVMRQRKQLSLPFSEYFTHFTKIPLALPDTAQPLLVR